MPRVALIKYHFNEIVNHYLVEPGAHGLLVELIHNGALSHVMTIGFSKKNSYLI